MKAIALSMAILAAASCAVAARAETVAPGDQQIADFRNFIAGRKFDQAAAMVIGKTTVRGEAASREFADGTTFLRWLDTCRPRDLLKYPSAGEHGEKKTENWYLNCPAATGSGSELFSFFVESSGSGIKIW